METYYGSSRIILRVYLHLVQFVLPRDKRVKSRRIEMVVETRLDRLIP